MTRICPSCNIKVEGNFEQCPLCQNELTGEKGDMVYPSMETLKKGSFLYKLQMFIFITLMLVALSLEFLLDIKASFHYSLLACVWVVGGEIWLYRLIKRHNNPSKIIAICGWWTAILVLLTFLILDDVRPIYFFWILPGIAMVSEILHFVYMLLDKSQNAMVYLLGCSALCIVIGVSLMLYTGNKAILWVLCLLLGVVAIVGAVIFKGRGVTNELEKRFHI